MNRHPICLLLTVALEPFWAQPVARACSQIGPTTHVVDPALQATDHTPPALLSPPAVSVIRGQGPRQSGCSQSVSSCDGQGTIIIGVAVSDDLTPAAKIGYRLSLIAGTPPTELRLPASPIVPGVVGQIVLGWNDGESNDQEPLDFTVGVAAIDAAGNQSTVTTVRVQDPGSSGACGIAGSAGRNRGSAIAGLAVLLFGCVLARRRSRSPRRPGW